MRRNTKKKALWLNDKKKVKFFVYTVAVIVLFLTGGLFEGFPELSALFDTSTMSVVPDISSDQSGDDGYFQFTAIDVGQGDSILVKCGNKYILIDGGENGMDDTVCSYLSSKGITELEMVIATHPHSDHIGGLDTVISNFEVSAVMAPYLTEELVPTTNAYEKFLLAVKNKGLNIAKPTVGKVYDFDGVKMTVLGPVELDDELNNCSIIVKFEYINTSAICMGDAEKQEERSLISSGADLSADILKVGHHGSKTATSEELIQATGAKYGVISVASVNSYSLPDYEVIKQLSQYGVDYYSTALYGTVTFLSDGQKIEVSTEKGEI